MEDKAQATNCGAVVSVRGSVVDVRFDGHLPPIHSVLRAGAEGRIVIEVLAQRDARHVRGIALTPTQGLARGMAVSGLMGQMPSRLGCQPTMGTELSGLEERIANPDTGAITSIQAV